MDRPHGEVTAKLRAVGKLELRGRDRGNAGAEPDIDACRSQFPVQQTPHLRIVCFQQLLACSEQRDTARAA